MRRNVNGANNVYVGNTVIRKGCQKSNDALSKAKKCFRILSEIDEQMQSPAKNWRHVI